MIFGCRIVQLSGWQNNAWKFRVFHCIRIVLCLQTEPCPVGIAFSALANGIGGGQKFPVYSCIPGSLVLHSSKIPLERLYALAHRPSGCFFQQIVVVIARTVFQMDVFLMQPFFQSLSVP